MAESIENKFNVGDWVSCSEGRGWPQYINITLEIVSNYNDPEKIKAYSLKKIIGEDRLNGAREYLKQTISLRKGDYLRFDGGKKQVVDRIVEMPKINGDLFSIDSYICDGGFGPFHQVRTETGYGVKYFDAVRDKISEQEAQEFLDIQIGALEKDLEIFKSQHAELRARRFF
jgi:hypothetical protein